MTLRIVITSLGSFGDLNPYLGLGRALAARGHEPVLAIPAAYVPIAERAGLEARPVRPDVDLEAHDIIRRIMDPLRGAEYLVRDVVMPNVADAYDDLRTIARDADFLISHPLTYAAPIVAERLEIRWAASVLAPLGFFSRTDPPLIASHPLAAVVQRRWPDLYRRLMHLPHHASRGWSAPVAALRRTLSLPPGKDPVHAGQFSPHLVLAMFSRLLAAPQPDWPPNTVVTGAVQYDAIQGGIPEALQRFLDDGPPPVVFTLGSAAVAAAGARDFYAASVEAIRKLGGRAVLLVGKRSDNRPDVSDNADVFVADWAPHSQLFSRAAAIVHQGGAGTLHTALASGRPMLVVPFAHDQGDNAVRAERLGVARVLFPQRYRAATAHDQLRQLLGEPQYAERSAVVGEEVRRERGGEAACEAIECVARG